MTDQEVYQSAADALDDIINSRDATAAQKKTATDKREDLTMNFIGQVIDKIDHQRGLPISGRGRNNDQAVSQPLHQAV